MYKGGGKRIREFDLKYYFMKKKIRFWSFANNSEPSTLTFLLFF